MKNENETISQARISCYRKSCVACRHKTAKIVTEKVFPGENVGYSNSPARKNARDCLAPIKLAGARVRTRSLPASNTIHIKDNHYKQCKLIPQRKFFSAHARCIPQNCLVSQQTISTPNATGSPTTRAIESKTT